MISGLWNGVSGLNTFEKALDAQSNNVSNSNTIAHKSDELSFEDLMYQSRYGKGVAIQSIEKNFSQGNLKITDNSLDVALEGDGFFMVQETVINNNGETEYETFYTRAGNFKMGNDGTLQSSDDKRVIGSPTTISNIVSSDDNQQFNGNYTTFISSQAISSTDYFSTINAKSTDFTLTAQDSGVSGQGFKTASALTADARALITDYNEKLELYASNPNAASVASTSEISQIDFSDFATKLQNDGNYIDIYVNDTKVRQYFEEDPQTTMNEFADKISKVAGVTGTVDANGLVTITALIPGEDIKVYTPSINEDPYLVNELTAATTGSGIGMVNSSRDALKTAIEAAGGQFLELTNRVVNTDANNELNGLTSLQLKLDSLNISNNVFGELSIDDGLIYSKDGNNSFLVGKIETVNFYNPESLEAQGENLYSSTKDTSEARNSNNINKIVGGALELSNTNFSDSLVDLMVYQRAFEASSKSVTTSDEFLRTAIELKK